MSKILFALFLLFSGFFLAGQIPVSAEVSGVHGCQLLAHNMQDMEMPMMKAEGAVADLKTEPAVITAGTPSTLTVSIKDNDGKPAQELSITHERILHVIIVSGDFNVFSHIHPEDFGPVTTEMKKTAQFQVRYIFPKAGRYLIGLDFAVKDQPYSRHFVVDVAGEPQMGALTKDFSRGKSFGVYNVTLTSEPGSIMAGKEVILTYLLKRDGEPVTDLEPYLAATMHVGIISTDLKQFMHEHGMLPGMTDMGEMHRHQMMPGMMIPDKFGPLIEVHTVFPTRGAYEIFGEVKHQGKVIVTHFMVEVE